MPKLFVYIVGAAVFGESFAVDPLLRRECISIFLIGFSVNSSPTPFDH